MVWKRLRLSSHSVLLARFCLEELMLLGLTLPLTLLKEPYVQILFISQAQRSQLVRQMGKEQ